MGSVRAFNSRITGAAKRALRETTKLKEPTDQHGHLLRDIAKDYARSEPIALNKIKRRPELKELGIERDDAARAVNRFFEIIKEEATPSAGRTKRRAGSAKQNGRPSPAELTFDFKGVIEKQLGPIIRDTKTRGRRLPEIMQIRNIVLESAVLVMERLGIENAKKNLTKKIGGTSLRYGEFERRLDPSGKAGEEAFSRLRELGVIFRSHETGYDDVYHLHPLIVESHGLKKVGGKWSIRDRTQFAIFADSTILTLNFGDGVGS